jgi:ferredoxin
MRYLKTLRVCVAVLVALAVAVAFLDFRDVVFSALNHVLRAMDAPTLANHLAGDTAPATFKHAVTAVQFGPSAMALLTGVGFSIACIVLLAVTALVGRVYCSTLCPLGLLQDAVARVAGWFRKKSRKIRLPFRPPLQVLRQSILAATVLGVAVGWGGVVFAWLDPYSQFGRIASGVFRPLLLLANYFVASVTLAMGLDVTSRIPVPWAGFGALLPPLLILSAIVVLSAWRGRLYCSAICPVGTLLGWVSKKALFRLSIDKSACVRCGDCQRACKAQCIDLRSQTVDLSRCVGCFNCVSVCDEHGIGLNWLGRAKPRGTLPERRLAPAAASVPSVAKPVPVASVPSSPPISRRAFVSGLGGVAVAGGVGLFGARVGARADAGRTASPPGSGGRGHFLDQCTACQLCVSACPSNVLAPALSQYGRAAGFMKPYMDFTHGFCNFNCTVCGDVCPDGAIHPLALKEKQTTCIGVAKVTIDLCIVRTDKTACGACAEHCPTAALQMKPGKGEFPEPVVNEAYCIGCGACQYICPAVPVRAVVIHGREKHREASVLVQEKVKDPNAGVEDFPF